MASAAAQKYFDSFTQADRDSIKASWGGADLMDEWYDNAKKAEATPATPAGATPPATGPTSNQSDADYIAEVRASGQVAGKPEDYARFTDAEILSWKKYYQGGGKFKNDYGDIVDKPDERGPNTPGNRNGTGDQGDYGRGWNTTSLDSEGGGSDGGGGKGGRGGPAGPPPPPPPPVTFGNQLTMTGNPLQDMLIGQFNTGQDPSTYQNNIFGLGEDMRVGGAGNNADASKVRQGQSLSGGGLWWGQDKETFSGFDASTKNAEGAATASPAAPAAPAPTPPAAPTPAPVQSNGPSRQGGGHVAGPNNRGVATPAYQGFQAPRPKPTPLTNMTSTQYNNPVRNKPSYF